MSAGEFWFASGPAAFLRSVADLASAPGATVCLRLPNSPPAGTLDAVRRAIRETLGAKVVTAYAAAGLGPRGPAHWLASRAGRGATAIRAFSDFLDAPDLCDTVFLVHGAPRQEWRSWSIFLRAIRDERARQPRVAAPAVIFVPDVGVPRPELDGVFALGSLVRWLGMVGRLDAEAFAEAARTCRAEDCDLSGRAALATAVEVGGWDHRLVAHLAAAEDRDALNPIPMLKEMAARLPDIGVPLWANGLVDAWDGAPFEHALSLLARGREDVVRQRVWRAHLRTVYPFLDHVRLAVARRHRRELLAGGPWVRRNGRGEVVEVISDPDRFELGIIRSRLRSVLPPADAKFLLVCYNARNRLAHHDPIGADWITSMSVYWDAHATRYPDDALGWDWPRCGQKLVILTGKPGPERTAGAKARLAAAEFVSPDGQGEPRGREDARWRLRDEVRRRIAEGHSAVLDADHDDGHDHLAAARSVPADIHVEFLAPDGTATPWDPAKPPFRERAVIIAVPAGADVADPDADALDQDDAATKKAAA